jgi:hypothetical protein
MPSLLCRFGLLARGRFSLFQLTPLCVGPGRDRGLESFENAVCQQQRAENASGVHCATGQPGLLVFFLLNFSFLLGNQSHTAPTVRQEELQVAHNQLTDVPEGLFTACANLQQLHVHNNYITTLPVAVYALADLCDLSTAGNTGFSMPKKPVPKAASCSETYGVDFSSGAILATGTSATGAAILFEVTFFSFSFHCFWCFFAEQNDWLGDFGPLKPDDPADTIVITRVCFDMVMLPIFYF